MEQYQRHLARSGVKVVVCSAYEVMQFSDLALVTSGTATLESLCFGVPMIVLYKTGRINYFIGKRLVKLPNISLANIVAKGLGEAEQMVPELLQHQANAEEITRAARRILDDRTVASSMRAGLLEARSRLSSVSPSHKVARILAEYL
jgi:lipid-A-disaccharide synthase